MEIRTKAHDFILFLFFCLRGCGPNPGTSIYNLKNFPVYDRSFLAISSGAPSATTVPLAGPPSGPRSMTQSDARMRSLLCSTTKAGRSPVAAASEKMCFPVLDGFPFLPRGRLSAGPAPHARPLLIVAFRPFIMNDEQNQPESFVIKQGSKNFQ